MNTLAQNPMPKRQNDPEKTRENILDVALKEFSERGFSGARVDEIASKTKTSKRMLYYYFGDKEGLYRAVLRAAYVNIRQAEQKLDLSSLAPDQALRKLVRFTMEHHSSHPAYVRLIMIENIHHGRYMAQLDDIVDMNAGAIEVLEKIYADGCEQGLFRKGVALIDVHWLISALSFFSVSNKATFGLLFKKQLAGKAGDDKEQLAEDIVLQFVQA